MAQTLGIRAWNAEGNLVKDLVGTFDEDPEFYAHQLLHVDGIVCVEIRVPSDEQGTEAQVILQQCDPGIDFNQVVNE